MGEAKRRKQEDPNFGKTTNFFKEPHKIDKIINGHLKELFEVFIIGSITPVDDDYHVKFSSKGLNAELTPIVKYILEEAYTRLSEKYNYEKTSCNFQLDFRPVITIRKAVITLYPSYLDEELVEEKPIYYIEAEQIIKTVATFIKIKNLPGFDALMKIIDAKINFKPSISAWWYYGDDYVQIIFPDDDKELPIPTEMFFDAIKQRLKMSKIPSTFIFYDSEKDSTRGIESEEWDNDVTEFCIKHELATRSI